MKTFWKGFIAAGSLLVVLGACSSGNDEAGGSETAEGQEEQQEITIGFSQVTLESPFYIELVNGAEEAAAEQGVTLDIVDAQNDIEKQNSDVNSLITKGIDVLLLNPANPSSVAPSLKAAENAGVPVITIDRETNDEVTAYVGRDNKEMGMYAGEKAVDLLGGKGNAKGKIIEIQGDAGGIVMQARHDGFHHIVSEEEGIEVIEGPYSEYIRSKAVSAMQDLLQAHPDVDLVYAHNDDMALGAIQVLSQSNMLDDVKVVGVDGLMEALKKIDAGEMDGTVINDPYELGTLAVEAAIKAANGEEIDKFIVGGTGLIDQSNVGNYLDEESSFARIQ
ncbi:substrate-binding domain-containing protein [Alkalicoccobacillus porphyridii]|nr:substrate-binding domain-containing protein [Alkalicoccobacillus porphyridii]